MRIDGPDRPDIHGPAEAGNGAVRRGGLTDAKPAASAEKADTLHAASQPYIRKAAAAGDVDLQAVAEARKLLESGELDTPAAAERAAERMLSAGI